MWRLLSLHPPNELMIDLEQLSVAGQRCAKSAANSSLLVLRGVSAGYKLKSDRYSCAAGGPIIARFVAGVRLWRGRLLNKCAIALKKQGQ